MNSIALNSLVHGKYLPSLRGQPPHCFLVTAVSIKWMGGVGDREAERRIKKDGEEVEVEVEVSGGTSDGEREEKNRKGTKPELGWQTQTQRV